MAVTRLALGGSGAAYQGFDAKAESTATSSIMLPLMGVGSFYWIVAWMGAR